MTLNNRTFTLLKIVLLIIISIFIAEIIVLPKIEHDMLQEAGRQELVTVQQICGAVLENYPDVEQDFILGLRQPTNSLQEKGEQILKQYVDSMSHLRRLEDAQPISDKSNISGYVTAIADSARILCEQSGKTLSIQNNISDIPIGIDYTIVSQVNNNLISNAIRYNISNVSIIYSS